MNNLFYEEYLKMFRDDLERDISFSINGHIFNNVEIVSSSNDLRNGLMWRSELDDDEAMIFCFDNLSVRNFWMKNTLIPLDVIFLDENKRVISFYSMNIEKQKLDDESEKEYERRLKKYSSIRPCKYAIEINFGICDEVNLKIGEQIVF